ncbi:MAG: hypothetical protein ABSB63_10715 [Spirochaetia bacterium]|jgi:hypothetical protein
MAKRELTPDQYEARRRKEQLAFLVVKFLRANALFISIDAEFRRLAKEGNLAGGGLFVRVRDLEDSLVFELKEKAHFLFRNDPRAANGVKGVSKTGSRTTHELLAGMKNSIESRAIDSYIGTGYHLLLILQESLYQIELYAPELEREKREISRILELARTTGNVFSPEERAELERLQSLSELSVKFAAESEELALRVAERCEALFAGTAEVIRHFMASARDNEILIQNLVQNRDLLEQVYGEGAAERIFSELCKGKGYTGRTGLERALNFARAKCGNITALKEA